MLNTDQNDPSYLLNLEIGLFAVSSVFDDDNYFDKKNDFMF